MTEKSKQQKRLPVLMYIVTVVFLAAVTLLSCLLNFLSYRTHITAITAHSYSISLSPTISNIEYALTFGKPIDHFYGMQNLLAEQCERVGTIKNLYVLDENKKLLHSAYPVTDSALPKDYTLNEYSIGNNRLWYPIPLAKTSTLMIEADLSGIKAAEGQYLWQLLRFGLLELAVFALIALLLYALAQYKKAGIRALKNLSVGILVLSQLALGIFTYNSYLASYKASFASLANIVASTVERDTQKLTNLGIATDEFYEFDSYLANYKEKLPEFDTIRVASDQAPAGGNAIEAPLNFGDETRRIVCTISSKTLGQITFQYVISTLLLLAISILLITETQFLLSAKLGSLSAGAAPAQGEDTGKGHAMMRMLVFVLYACVNMGLAISPIAASRLYTPALGLDKGFAIGLPITAEMFMGLAAILLAGIFIGRLGMKRSFVLAIALTALGLAGSAFSFNIPLYAIARGAVGFGYGMITILGRTYASSQQTESARTDALANLSGGSIAGLCFGSILGGILSEHISFGGVFFISAALLLIGFALLPFILFNNPGINEASSKKPFAGILSVLGNLSSLSYLLLLVVPVYACSIFISYVVPLSGSSFELSTSAISALIMANSLLAGYLSPAMTGWCMKHLGLKKGILLYILATVAAITVYAVFPNLVVLLATVCVLGIADSFGIVMLLEGFSRTKGAATGDTSSGMIVVTMAGKAGQALAPSLMLLPIPLSGAGGSCLVLAGFAALGGICYTLGSRISAHRKKKDEVKV